MIDEYLGPVQHLVNLRPPVTPPTVGRRSSIRPMSRTSGVDFDQLPSPRPMSSVHRSGLNGGPGPSGLSRTRSYREPEPPSDSPNGNLDYGDEARDQSMFDDYRPQEDDSPGSFPHEKNFSRIEQDDDDEDEQEEEEAADPEETPKPSRRLEKGKGKAREEWPEQDEEAEDEIATGLGDVDLEPESDASREEPPQKKSKKVPVKRNTATKTQQKKENKRMPYSISARFFR